MFRFDGEESFPQREERILRFWEEGKIFERSVEERQGEPCFSFYDGPPFATGLPHYGHLLAGTIKDVIPRYKTMQGFCVPRRFGWDCHGLPIENEIEKGEGLSGADAIEAFGIDRFNEACRCIVFRYTGEWKKMVDRMGRWVDFDHTYRTMDRSFMESVWWVFQTLYDKGLIYQGMKVMPFSTRLGTPLSNFEAHLNYQEVDDPSIVVAFELCHDPGTFFLAWTTTPWTLPSNLALMVGPAIEYVKVAWGGKRYIVARSRSSALFQGQEELLESMPGQALRGLTYRPLFPFFADRAVEGAFRVVVEDSVSADEGTGVVHAAPAFGEVDFFACQREKIALVCPIDVNGRFTEEVPPYRGQEVKGADRAIVRDLKKGGHLFSQGTIRHRYPICWRSDTPLIYKAVSTWFVAVEKIKEAVISANQSIHWVPAHLKQGRFGKWLEQARDWAISRSRYWGTPIPLWKSPSGRYKVVGSVGELEALTGQKVGDLHRHHIDPLTFTWQGERFERIPEVFDCWFESGSMPYAQGHYPFEGKELFDASFPADFIAEGLDQTRGWFYTLTVLSAALFNQPAFRHVIVNGIILAEDGNKMSKRLKNYPDPDLVIQKYGADALRLYLLGSPAVKGDDLRFSEKGVERSLRHLLIPLWNAFLFFSTYATIYRWVPPSSFFPSPFLLDRWIVSRTQRLIREVKRGLEAYELSEAVEPLVGFIDGLTNWYIRRSRHRFWADEESEERHFAFSTLFYVLKEFTRVSAPFIPFLSEAIYQELKQEGEADSVHLTRFPSEHVGWRDDLLEEAVERAQLAVRLGHALRKEHGWKVRQPLARAHLITANPSWLETLRQQEGLIRDELNVKELLFHDEEGDFVSWTAKPNFPVLGKKLGARMPHAAAQIALLSSSAIQTLFQGESPDSHER